MRLVWGVEWKEMWKVAIFRKGAIRKCQTVRDNFTTGH